MTLPLHRQLESQSGATDGGFGLEMVGERLDKTIQFKILLHNSLLRGPPYPVGVI